MVELISSSFRGDAERCTALTEDHNYTIPLYQTRQPQCQSCAACVVGISRVVRNVVHIVLESSEVSLKITAVDGLDSLPVLSGLPTVCPRRC
jgi:hypothetical protein